MTSEQCLNVKALLTTFNLEFYIYLILNKNGIWGAALLSKQVPQIGTAAVDDDVRAGQVGTKVWQGAGDFVG